MTSDDAAAVAAEEVDEFSSEVDQLLRGASDADLASAYDQSGGEVGHPVAEALLGEIKRRNLDIRPMCNRARNRGEPQTLIERLNVGWLTDRPMDNRFNPVELAPRSLAYVIRRENEATGLDVVDQRDQLAAALDSCGRATSDVDT